MRPLCELINVTEPAMPLVLDWLSRYELPYKILPRGANSGQDLYKTQVTTRSPMGSIIYETGGIVIDNGWIRVLGSGGSEMNRSLPDWNDGKSDKFILIGDDAVGGFFALNGGSFGEDLGTVYYWAPDSTGWISMSMNYSQWLIWCGTINVHEYYSDLKWDGWENDLLSITADKCMSFYPFLWTKEGSISASHRGIVPIQEAYGLKCDILGNI